MRYDELPQSDNVEDRRGEGGGGGGGFGFPMGLGGGGLGIGTMVILGIVGYALGIKNTFTMSVEYYTGVDERLDLPMLLPPIPDLVDFDETRVLIADDVADTGATLALVKDFCAGRVAEVR